MFSTSSRRSDPSADGLIGNTPGPKGLIVRARVWSAVTAVTAFTAAEPPISLEPLPFRGE